MRPSSPESSARWAAALRHTARATSTASAAAFRSGVFTVLPFSAWCCSSVLLTPALRVGVDPQVGGPGRDGVGHVELGRCAAVVVGDVGHAARGEEALAGLEGDRFAGRRPLEDD